MKNLFNKYREHTLTGLIILLALLNYVSYQTGLGVGEQVDTLARPTSIVPSLTPKPTRGTPLATATQIATATLTPKPTTGATSTPGVGSPTSTPVSLDPCSHWHGWQVDLRYPGLSPFSYGFNPCESLALYGPEYEAYLLDQNVDGLPHSSALEEPNGWRWLRVRVEKDGTQSTGVLPGEGCAFFDNNPQVPPPDRLCITNLTVRVHNPGDAMHAHKRFHSIIVVARVCAVENGLPVEPCGTVGTAAIEDWGVKHQPYKTQLCYDDTTPKDANGNLYPFDLIGQPPYVAFQPARNGFAHQFISTVTFNPIVEPYYLNALPELPNRIIRGSWNLMDAKEVFVCNGEAIPTGYDASAYILHAMNLANLPTARPFSGFTDANGYVDPTCTEVSNVCMPLWITAGVPQGIPFLSYPVQFDGKNADGSPTGVIVQEFNP